VFSDPAMRCAFTRRAVETGQYSVCNNVPLAPEAAPWRGLAVERGYLSRVSLALNAPGRRVRVFNLYANVTDFFTDNELRLLEDLAANISLALEAHHLEIERQRAELERRAHEERFRLLIENASDMILALNEQGLIRFASPAAKRCLGCEPGELIGRGIYE